MDTCKATTEAYTILGGKVVVTCLEEEGHTDDHFGYHEEIGGVWWTNVEIRGSHEA
jgi:hypothetical protein